MGSVWDQPRYKTNLMSSTPHRSRKAVCMAPAIVYGTCHVVVVVVVVPNRTRRSVCDEKRAVVKQNKPLAQHCTYRTILGSVQDTKGWESLSQHCCCLFRVVVSQHQPEWIEFVAAVLKDPTTNNISIDTLSLKKGTHNGQIVGSRQGGNTPQIPLEIKNGGFLLLLNRDCKQHTHKR